MCRRLINGGLFDSGLFCPLNTTWGFFWEWFTRGNGFWFVNWFLDGVFSSFLCCQSINSLLKFFGLSLLLRQGLLWVFPFLVWVKIVLLFPFCLDLFRSRTDFFGWRPIPRMFILNVYKSSFHLVYKLLLLWRGFWWQLNFLRVLSLFRFRSRTPFLVSFYRAVSKRAFIIVWWFFRSVHNTLG